MKALLLVAHGSRRKQSNEEVDVLAQKLYRQCSTQYPIVRSAFLELAEPSIPDGLRRCAEAGATEIVVLPYFLNSGRHVISDIPEIVNSVRADLPAVEIKLGSHIGASSMMLELLIERAGSAA